jgi:hypothetical protein
MQPRNIVLLAILAVGVSGCDAIAGIFRAGFWVGIILVLLILGLIGFFVRGRR